MRIIPQVRNSNKIKHINSKIISLQRELISQSVTQMNFVILGTTTIILRTAISDLAYQRSQGEQILLLDLLFPIIAV